jgi:iron complex outermembrane receptor protein
VILLSAAIGACAGCAGGAVWMLAALAAAQGDPTASALPRVSEQIAVIGTAEDDASEAARRTSIERSDLVALPAETLSEAISELPGIVVLFDSPFGGTPMIVARGFFGGGEVDYLGLEVDGVPSADAESGLADWRGLRLDGVERIDLLSGPASRRGGVDPALAGTVRVISRPPGADPAAEAAISGASFDTLSASARWSGPLGAPGAPSGWRAALSTDAMETAGYREHSAADEQGVSLKLERTTSAGKWELSSAARWRNREEPGPLSESELADDPLASQPLFEEDRERADRWGVAARWEGSSPRLPLEGRLAAGGRSSRFVRTLLVAEGVGDRAVRRLRTGGFAAGLATPVEIELGRWGGMRFAVDYRNDEVDTRYAAFETGESRAYDRAGREHWSGEVGFALRLHPRFEVDSSLRSDLVRDRSRVQGSSRRRASSPRLGAVWKLVDRAGRELAVVADLGRAFKAPTLDQLFDPRPFGGPEGDFTLSNPALEPQRSRGWEIGLRERTPRADWRVGLYRLAVENEIDFDPATFRYANIGRSRHEGVESALRVRIGRAGELRAAYAHSRVQAEGAAATGQLKNVPRDVLRLGWSVRLPGRIDLDLRQSWFAGRWADDAHRHPLEDVTRTDLRLARALGSFRLRVDVLNLFDRDALELAYVLPDATGEGETLHGFAPAPRAFRFGIEKTW